VFCCAGTAEVRPAKAATATKNNFILAGDIEASVMRINNALFQLVNV
jgi:hypothetical protein